MINHRLLVFIVDQHLILGVLLNIEHLLLLVAHAMVALREGAVLLVRNLLLRLLLMILHVYLSRTYAGLALVYLRRGLTVLLDQHGRVHLVHHSITLSNVHARLLVLLESL